MVRLGWVDGSQGKEADNAGWDGKVQVRYCKYCIVSKVQYSVG